MHKTLTIALFIALFAFTAAGQTTATFTPLSRDLADVAFGKTKLTAYSVTVIGPTDSVPLGKVLAAVPALAVVPRPLALAALAQAQRVSKPHLIVKIAKEAALLGMGLLASGTIGGDARVGTALVSAFTVANRAADATSTAMDWGQIDRYQQLACPDVVKLTDGAAPACIVLTTGAKAKSLTVKVE